MGSYILLTNNDSASFGRSLDRLSSNTSLAPENSLFEHTLAEGADKYFLVLPCH